MCTNVFEQIQLFDTGLNLTAIRAEGKKLEAFERAAQTEYAYGWSWRIFTKWCERAGKLPLPADSATIEDFVTWAAVARDDAMPYRPATIRLFVSAVVREHQKQGFASPVSPRARLLLHNAARNPVQAESTQKDALTPAQLVKICGGLDSADDLLSIRNRAMIALGFAGGFRRSEIAGLELRDVQIIENEIAVRLRKSKTDQTFEGRTVVVQKTKRKVTCPLRQLRRWLQVRGEWAGPLFCSVQHNRIHDKFVGGEALCSAVQRGLERIGVDSSAYGAHSLRSGFVTAAADNGASELVIRARTGHKQIGMLARYVRDRQGMRVNPLKGVL